MKLFTYHEPIEGFPDQTPLIDLWRRSWERHGFECVVLPPSNDFNDRWVYDLEHSWKAWLDRSNNCWPYTRACYRRWHAYASQGLTGDIVFCDYDVINRGVTPADIRSVPDRLWIGERDGVPCLGRASRAVIGNICRLFRNAAVLRRAGTHCVRDDLSDMNLIRDFAEFEKGDVVGLALRPEDAQAKAMHFTNHFQYPEGNRIAAAQAWYAKQT